MHPCQVNLVQSYNVNLDENAKISDELKSQMFVDTLSQELSQRGLSRQDDEMELLPIGVDGNKQVKNLQGVNLKVNPDPEEDSKTRQMLIETNKNLMFCGILANQDINEQIRSLIREENKTLHLKIDSMIELMSQTNKLALYPQILRQLIFELRVAAINEIQPGSLSKEDSKYFNANLNDNFDHVKFKGDYDKLLEAMKLKFPKTLNDNQYYVKLFNHPVYKLNSEVHRPCNTYDSELIKKAVCETLDLDSLDGMIHPLITFYNKWKELNTVCDS